MHKHFKHFSLAAAVCLTLGSCTKQLEETLPGSGSVALLSAGTIPAISGTTAEININWNQTYQQWTGFGTFGGRIVPFFQSPKRDSVMEMLFGTAGLQLNMVRGKVLHTYPFNEQTGTVTIKPSASIDIQPNDAAWQQLSEDEKEQLAQVWILKKIKERYQIPIMFASAWTPPLHMKTNPGQVSGQNFNKLAPAYYSAYAKYLAGFTKAFAAEGINFQAISPLNEPENVISEWDACYWTSGDLGTFVNDHLRPTLNNAGLTGTKIISAENAAWGTANSFLSGMNTGNVDIFAGHGYPEIIDLPGLLISKKPRYNQRPAPWNFASANKPVWLTEISDDNGIYDNRRTCTGHQHA